MHVLIKKYINLNNAKNIRFSMNTDDILLQRY